MNVRGAAAAGPLCTIRPRKTGRLKPAPYICAARKRKATLLVPAARRQQSVYGYTADGYATHPPHPARPLLMGCA